MQMTHPLGSRKEKWAVYKHALAVTAPIALQNFMDAAVGSADVIMLSFVSQSALAASSLAGQVNFVMQMLMFGVASGASILSAQYWGLHPKEQTAHGGMAFRPRPVRYRQLCRALRTILFAYR